MIDDIFLYTSIGNIYIYIREAEKIGNIINDYYAIFHVKVKLHRIIDEVYWSMTHVD